MVDKKEKKKMITISIEQEVAESLKELGHMHDTYSTVIRRLMNGSKPHERGITREHE